MKKEIFTLLIFCPLVLWGPRAAARIWRVNNNVGINADFADFPAAVTGASAGDTIYLESSATTYTGASLSKKLVIMGTGYYLSGTHLNPNTQANTNPSTLSYIYFVSGSAGSVLSGMTIGSNLLLGDNTITIERCNMGTTYLYLGYTGNSNNDTIRQNVLYIISGYSASYGATNTLIYNNIITYGINFTTNIGGINGYLINNDIGSTTYGAAYISASNFTFQNNILYAPSLGTYASTNVYFNNIISTSSATSGIPAGNANVFSVTDFTTVYVGWGADASNYSPDGDYALASGSPALGAGALNSTTVDCGAFGGPAPYVLSGMPGIPSIYALTAPSQVNTGTASINVTISAASH
ncbi:MAG TPA: hypothetical protein VL978_03580 [Puia sp.]|nr:hypothetical protein [Puia sp.]